MYCSWEGDVPFFLFIQPHPTPPKVDRFLNRRSFDLFFKQADKISTLWTNLSTKKEPFGFHFQKGAKQKFEDSDSVIFKGEGGTSTDTEE